jgi:hypothetical protein
VLCRLTDVNHTHACTHTAKVAGAGSCCDLCVYVCVCLAFRVCVCMYPPGTTSHKCPVLYKH